METNQCVCGGEAGGVLANHSKRCDEVLTAQSTLTASTTSSYAATIGLVSARIRDIEIICHNILKNTCQLNVIVVTMISIEIHIFLMSYGLFGHCVFFIILSVFDILTFGNGLRLSREKQWEC